ncbi:hypothetical protein JTB14_004621 [Gonioctena quinquepunctata]|nr:hypothetical protein JTB14_004621 [Gonioctena quinquepunctata]
MRGLESGGRSSPPFLYRAFNREQKNRTKEQLELLRTTREYFFELFRDRTGIVDSAPVFVPTKDDNRPYLKINIFDKDFVGLLDSGSNRSIVGRSGLDVIEMFELKVRPTSTKFVSTADGVRQTIEGIVDIPLRLDNSSKIIPFIVVPSLCHSFIFGSDFCKTFNIKINFEERVINVNSVSDEQQTRSDDHLLSFENLSEYQRERVETISEEFTELSRGTVKDSQSTRTNAKYYNLRRRDLEFHVGDKVWKRNKVLSNASKNFSGKLAPRYSLCTIAKKKSKLVYNLKNENGSNAGEWHIQDLKPYHGSTSDLSESDEEQREKNLET